MSDLLPLLGLMVVGVLAVRYVSKALYDLLVDEAEEEPVEETE